MGNAAGSKDGGVIDPCNASLKNAHSNIKVLTEMSGDSEAGCATSNNKVVEWITEETLRVVCDRHFQVAEGEESDSELLE